ncbi:MAG: hypothetical protein WBO10_08955 [Pyrinomonadaceae bacterium]
MTIFEAISLILATMAIVVSFLAYRQGKRALSASEDSARHAGKANDLSLVQFFQSNMAATLAEIEKEKALGNEPATEALRFSYSFLWLAFFKKMAKELDPEGREKLAEYFRGVAGVGGNWDVEAFLSEVFADDYEPPSILE